MMKCLFQDLVEKLKLEVRGKHGETDRQYTGIFDISNAGSYLSANDHRLIVGLGDGGTVKTVAVRWPNGRTQMIERPETGRYHIIKEK